jgi:hypothetical protein
MRKRVDNFASLFKEINEVLKLTFAEKVFFTALFFGTLIGSLIILNYVIWG